MHANPLDCNSDFHSAVTGKQTARTPSKPPIPHGRLPVTEGAPRIRKPRFPFPPSSAFAISQSSDARPASSPRRSGAIPPPQSRQNTRGQRPAARIRSVSHFAPVKAAKIRKSIQPAGHQKFGPEIARAEKGTLLRRSFRRSPIERCTYKPYRAWGKTWWQWRK